jgi:histidine triad (HIT) family protein
MPASPDCIFCQIVAGTSTCAKVLEDDLTFTLMDLFPVARGHALVIPKEHASNIHEISDECIKAVASTTRRVADAIRRSLSPDGLGVFQLNGAASGQTIFHYHTHLIPRMEGDPITLHSRKMGDPADLEVVAKLIRDAVE